MTTYDGQCFLSLYYLPKNYWFDTKLPTLNSFTGTNKFSLPFMGQGQDFSDPGKQNLQKLMKLSGALLLYQNNLWAIFGKGTLCWSFTKQGSSCKPWDATTTACSHPLSGTSLHWWCLICAMFRIINLVIPYRRLYLTTNNSSHAICVGPEPIKYIWTYLLACRVVTAPDEKN